MGKCSKEEQCNSSMIACHKGNINAINVRLSAGADPNIADAEGAIWLHYAADGHCSKCVVQRVINYGADVIAANMMNESRLIVAC